MPLRTSFAALCAVLFGLTSLVICAEPDGPTYTDPAKAGKDYEVQGEYAAEGAPVAAQVIALGDGRFELVVYEGGLPGDGWKRGDGKRKAPGKTVADRTQFASQGLHATLQANTLTIRDDAGKFQLKKTERKSPTLGAEPPEGAVVLFDGTSAENFENGKMTDDGLLEANTWSKQKFGDHSLHLEFRTPFKPHARGQARGNSGMYVQSRYEVQVLDSFGLEGENNECGGIYSIAKPAVNMCLPPLTWQTYDYDFTAAKYDDEGNKTKNARITIRHNGVVIHDNLELPHGTPGRHAEGPGPDALYLQGHGNPVVYRNIWVVEK